MLETLMKQLEIVNNKIDKCIKDGDGYTYRLLLEERKNLLNLIDIHNTL